MPSLKLSVLDQSVARVGQPQDQSIRDTLALAERCEALGYERFWVSEHHSIPALVGTAPEVLMAAIAARTRRIRIGSAGVMLPHYAPFKVAEQFRVLDALAPGRIDLGVGRAPGGDMRTARLLNPRSAASTGDDFPRQVMELQAWVDGEAMPPGHPGHGVNMLPMSDTAPEVWMLGSSGYGAQLAAHLGLPYAFAWFITDGDGAREALDLYRATFRPGVIDRPRATLCLWALAAETEEEAWFQFRSRERARIDRLTGRFGPLLPPQQAQREYAPAERAQAEDLRRRSFVGSATQVRDRLLALAEELSLDELVIVTWTWDPAVQRRSYELLAEAFALAPG
ncbi:LLM class flavin-dependent oxidoreductase [Ramlibacter sp. MAHUQ-53]|uniref:LLM class flavin-dependent oxidoreductase n=1 Tax=unclassified Ramlibacter TaxID=2617605 RepID=UPI00363E73A2